jgi:hypothetical protein
MFDALEFHVGDIVALEGKTKNAAHNLKQWGGCTYEIETIGNPTKGIRNYDLLVRCLNGKDFRWVSPNDAKYRVLKKGRQLLCKIILAN